MADETTNDQQEGGVPAHSTMDVKFSGGDAAYGLTGAAPVVTSDERCVAYVGTDGERPIACGHVEDAHSFDVCLECMSGTYPGAEHAFAPPTPSQDAEGDRIQTPDGYTRENWLRITMNQWACWLERDEMIGEYQSDLASFESAIRAPYEDLVTAARDARSALVLLTSELNGQIGYIKGLGQGQYGRPHLAIDHAHAVGARVTDALARIEESLGGRKDG